MLQSDATAIHDLWLKATDVHYAFKKFVEAMPDDDDDSFYAHQSVMDRLDEAVGKLSDVANDAEKIMRDER